MNAPRVRTAGPGRPKDPEKRASILNAAKRLFPEHGFEGTSMDVVAAAAGVSKLTVYSHFTDKETLFVEAVKGRCAEQLPASLFDVEDVGSLRQQLEAIARAFFDLIVSEDAIALHRLLTAGSGKTEKLAQMFWDAGPQLVQAGFAEFLKREVAVRKLDIEDADLAASQFFCLLRGEPHARLLCGCQEFALDDAQVTAHIRANVDMFLRAYTSRT